MKLLEVRPQERQPYLRREDEFAWRLAELAVADPPVEQDVADECVNRLIDVTGVAIAAWDREPIVAARGQALAHPRERGATLFGAASHTVQCEWAAWANCAAVRELDFHDNFFGVEACHPGDSIPALLAVAQQTGCSGSDLIRGITTAYEIQIALAKAIPLAKFGIDHVAHLGPAMAGGISSMLKLPVAQAYQAIQLAAHLSVSTRQTRRGQISSWKAQAPGHIAQVAIAATDRAMRGECGPSPIYEGGFGLIPALLGGREAVYTVEIPDEAEGKRAILETYTKQHSAAYHGQAAIDLATRMRSEISNDLQNVESIVIHTHRAAHIGMGSGAGDSEKWDPKASRETLDHSLMYIFCVALQDGRWHHDGSYEPERAGRPDTVALWRKTETVEDSELSRRYYEPRSLDKFQGMRVVVTFYDGSTATGDIDVADAHPRGRKPFRREEYIHKFKSLTGSFIDETESSGFLNAALRLRDLRPHDLPSLRLGNTAEGKLAQDTGSAGNLLSLDLTYPWPPTDLHRGSRPCAGVHSSGWVIPEI